MKMFVFLATIYLGLLYSNVTAEFYYPDCEYAGLSCLDCNTQKLCINIFGLIHWSNTACANDVAGYSKPYCNPETDKCTNVRPDGCPTVTHFKCPRDGVFPDTNDCTFYYRCTNFTPESYTCPQNFVYKQDFGKCVFKLVDSECLEMESCGLVDYVRQYPGDPSLYYGCQASTFYFDACAPSETFNTTTEACDSICSKVGRVPVPQNCMKYYSCEETGFGLVAVEEFCPDGYGFNPNSLSCQEGYSVLCNELAILENDKYDFISKIPIIGWFTNTIRKILNLFKLNPAKILFMLRLSDETISTTILVADYIYRTKKIPPTTIKVLLNYIIDNLPSQLQYIYNILSQLGILKFDTLNRSTRSIPSHLSFINGLEEILCNANIDLVALMKDFEGKNPSEISADVLRRIMNTFGIPEDQIPHVLAMVKDRIIDVLNQLNARIGLPPLASHDQGILVIDVNVLDQTVDNIAKFAATRLYESDDVNRELFEISAREQYLRHRDELIGYVKNFYFNLDSF